MNPQRRKSAQTRLGRTRAESTAEARRARAMNHLKRVRGQAPTRTTPRAWFVAAAAMALLAGLFTGLDFASGSSWTTGDSELESVAIRGAKHLDGIDVAAAAGLERNASMLDLSLAAVEQRLEAHTWIADARALRLPGGRVVLDVDEREPAAVVAAGEPGQHYLVDADGRPFAAAANPDPELLRIVCATQPAVQEPHAEIARAIELARGVTALGLSRATEITVTPDHDPTGFSLRLAGVSPRIVLGRNDLDAKLSELARLLAASPGEIDAASELDLRFADQAVLRSERPPEEAASSGGDARMRGVVRTSG